MEISWWTYQNHNIAILHEIDALALYQIEGTTDCRYAAISDIEKEGKPFKGDTMKLPDIPVEFISFEGDDTVYLLNDRKFKINSEFCKQACNLQPGEIFTINHLLVSVSDLN